MLQQATGLTGRGDGDGVGLEPNCLVQRDKGMAQPWSTSRQIEDRTGGWLQSSRNGGARWQDRASISGVGDGGFGGGQVPEAPHQEATNNSSDWNGHRASGSRAIHR